MADSAEPGLSLAKSGPGLVTVMNNAMSGIRLWTKEIRSNLYVICGFADITEHDDDSYRAVTLQSQSRAPSLLSALHKHSSRIQHSLSAARSYVAASSLVATTLVAWKIQLLVV